MKVRIVSPNFVAGLELEDGRVTKTAPLLNYMVGWRIEEIARVCRRGGWTYEVDYETDEPPMA